MRKQVYLSGGIQGLSYAESNDWRIWFQNKFREFDSTIKVFNPNDHFTEYDLLLHEISPRSIMNYDLLRLRESRVVIVNYAHPKSLGTMAEIAIAYDRKIPVIGFNMPPHAWQKCMTDLIFRTKEDVLEYVCIHYFGGD